MSEPRATAERPDDRSVGRLRGLRPTLMVVAVLVVTLVPLVLRVAWEGRAELVAAEEAAGIGDFEAEVIHLGRAVRWRLPIAGHDEEALERLVALGTAREAAHEDQLALMAYREARRAILATRAVGLPHEETFHDLNRRIARLMAEQERQFDTDLSGVGDPYAYHLALLEAVPGPNPVRGHLAAWAFVGWLVATAGFVLRALDARGRLRLRSAVRWGLASLATLVAWAVLLRFAG